MTHTPTADKPRSLPRPVPILGPECNEFEAWSDEEQSIIDEVTSRNIADEVQGFDPY